MTKAATNAVSDSLARSELSAPGIRRRRCGRGFRYLGPGGAPLADGVARARIKALVIPPAWEDVWICPGADGHIQAVGTDVAGRRQYRYHDQWREQRDREKFDRMLEFGRALPRIRKVTEHDLRGRELTRNRVLAAAVRLIDLGFFRSGGDEYAAENETFGLATIRREHVTCSKGELVFDYIGKSDKHHVQALVDDLAHYEEGSTAGDVLGSMCVIDESAHAWQATELGTLATLARAVSNEINVRRTLTLAQESLQLAQELARSLQDSLLPPVLEPVPGLEVAASYVPAAGGTDVVGDFYDLFHIRGPWWCAVIGDVCGKGVEAAKLTALARYTLRAAASHSLSPAAILRELNTALVGQYHFDRFLTALVPP